MKNSANYEQKEDEYFSKKIFILNIIATFLIVILHSNPLKRIGIEDGNDYGLISVITNICIVAVPTFFFISSLLFYRNFSFSIIENKIHSRIYSLVIPYLIWNILFVCIYFVITKIPIIHNTMKMGDILQTPTIFIDAVVNSRFTPLWFVKDLIIFTAISPVILLSLKDIKKSLIFFLIALIYVMIKEPEYQSALYWFPIYYEGAIYGHFAICEKNILRIQPLFQNYRPLKYVLIFTLCTLLTIVYFDSRFEYLTRLLCPIMIWVTIDFFDIIRDKLMTKFVVKQWMKSMFFIYCTHYFFLNVLEKLVFISFGAGKVIIYSTFLLAPILTFVFLIYLAKILSRFSFYKYLSGYR